LSLRVRQASETLCDLVERLAEGGTCSRFSLTCDEDSLDDEILCCQVLSMQTLTSVALHFGAEIDDALHSPGEACGATLHIGSICMLAG
jgi:hypothetical protein